MKEDKTVEVNVLIATRHPPGDNWQLITDDKDPTIIKGLVPTLNKYFQTAIYKGPFRLDPMAGKLFAIKTEIEPEEAEQLWDIYGEGK